MEIENLGRYFENKILRRGYKYFKDRKITTINKLDNVIVANVSGSNVYKVRIQFNEEGMYIMHCNCPYSYNCKHEAAVLYSLKLEDTKSNSITEKVKEFNTTKELEKELTHQLKDFKRITGNDKVAEEELYIILRKYIEIILNEKDENKKYNYFSYLLKWIRRNSVNVLTNYLYEEYYSEDDYCFEDIVEDYELSSFEEPPIYVGTLYEHIFKDFSCILENMDMLNKYCSELIKNKENNELFLKEICTLINSVKNKEMAKSVIEMLKKLVKKDEYNFEEYETEILRLQYRYLNQDKVIEFLKENIHLNHLRDLLIELTETNVERYQEVLEKIYNINREYTPKKYIAQLGEIYLKKGEIDKYKDIAKVILLKSQDIHTYLEIKTMYLADEWDHIKYKYIDKENIYFYVNVLIEEEMFDEVFKFIGKLDIYYICKFMNTLMLINKKKAFTLFKNGMIRKMRIASGREDYEEAIEYLKTINIYIQEDDCQRKIINDFIKKYPNKKEMVSELEFYRDTYL